MRNSFENSCEKLEYLIYYSSRWKKYYLSNGDLHLLQFLRKFMIIQNSRLFIKLATLANQFLAPCDGHLLKTAHDCADHNF